MKLFEAAKRDKTDIPTAMSKLLDKYFSISIGPDDIRNSVKNMSLTDMIELDNAISSKNVEMIEELLKGKLTLEYTMPNRGDLTSKASSTPKPSKVQTTTGTDSSSDDNKDTETNTNDSDSTIGTMGPSELKDKNEIEDATAEIEKLKKIAGVK
jgi:hypothetical protein